MNKYKQNLKIQGDKVISYDTHVAIATQMNLTIIHN